MEQAQSLVAQFLEPCAQALTRAGWSGAHEAAGEEGPGV
jgi:hypothetical protein